MKARHYRMYPPDAYLGASEDEVAVERPAAALVLVDVYGTGYADGESTSPLPGYMGKLDVAAKRDVVRAGLVPALAAARGAGLAVVYATSAAPRAALERTSYAAVQRRLGSEITVDFAEADNDAHEYVAGPSTVLRFSQLLAPHPGDYYVRKWAYSAFHDTRLDRLLRNLRVRDVFLAGFTAETGLLCSALDALQRGYRVFWLRDATLALGDRADSRAVTDRLTLWAENYVGYSVATPDFVTMCRDQQAAGDAFRGQRPT